MKYAELILGSVIALSVISCSDIKEAAKGVQQSVTNPNLMGTWSAGCTDDAIFDAASVQRFYQFSGATTTEVIEVYEEGDCKKPAARLTYTGDFKIKGDAAGVEGAKRVRLTREKAYLEATSPAGKTILETVNACGQDSWEPNQRKEVTDQADDVDCPIGELPHVSENIAQAEDDALYFGTEWKEGASVDEAVEALDKDTLYSKSEKTFE